MARGLRWPKGSTKAPRGRTARSGKPKGHIQLLFYLPSLNWVLEYRFHPVRKWRFDAALRHNGLMVAVEMDGGLFVRGRHSRGAGIVKDMEKLNAATLLGWRVLRYTPQQIKAGLAYKDVLTLLTR